MKAQTAAEQGLRRIQGVLDKLEREAQRSGGISASSGNRAWDELGKAFVVLSNLLSYSYKLDKDLDYWEQK